MMGGDRGVDEIAAQHPDARQCAVLVSAGEPAVAGNIRNRFAASFRVSVIAALPPGAAHKALPWRPALERVD
jgi:hypothetical protein